MVATASGIVTNIATDQASLAWWVSLGTLLVVGVTAQIWLTSTEGQNQSVTAAGAGSVAVGGSAQSTIRTRVRGYAQQTPPTGTSEGTTAGAPGSIAVGGEAIGDLSTDADSAN